MSSWQTVYQSANPHQTEIVKDVLINAGLKAIVFNKQDHAYKFGNIEVKVDPDSVMRAIKIIEEEINFNHE
ncbi:DUF2007 domain-containing protein [Roseivirga sp. E12]|uniref:DUF2007 domain-containing protein n=1 Tax=Roseivirga sp. E12 TaxID=2819237 RepID=UPI001ABC2144|nr:DUF2007 domain-containing protein [Roseivirga sp. E12]MBO3699358.1 DUF2007 domain-containing protein [Roseivirga sp. E12]